MVTFETKVWEKDWEYILKGNYLEKIIAANNYAFKRKQIIINNVNNRNEVEKYCKKQIKEGVIDCYFVVEDYESEVLEHFGIEKQSFAGGYYYSIAELVGIYLCETDYLLHYSSDSFIKSNQLNWINEAVEIMEENPDIFVANATWNDNFEEVRKGTIDEIGNFSVGRGFSDQCYLVRTKDFMFPMYHDKNPLSERYPKYGGELFEKRVDAYMRNNEKLRITHKQASYRSTNFPRDWFSRKIMRQKIIQKRLNQIQK